jgi:hypothetical protein
MGERGNWFPGASLPVPAPPPEGRPFARPPTYGLTVGVFLVCNASGRKGVVVRVVDSGLDRGARFKGRLLLVVVRRSWSSARTDDGPPNPGSRARGESFRGAAPMLRPHPRDHGHARPVTTRSSSRRSRGTGPLAIGARSGDPRGARGKAPATRGQHNPPRHTLSVDSILTRVCTDLRPCEHRPNTVDAIPCPARSGGSRAAVWPPIGEHGRTTAETSSRADRADPRAPPVCSPSSRSVRGYPRRAPRSPMSMRP